MAHNKHIRRWHLVALIVIAVAIVMTAQTKGDITARIINKGQVTVQAPAELAARNNNDLNRNITARSSKNEERDNQDEDKESKDKKNDKREDNRPPRRNHTTQQTIQARGTGYRIQAYSDNNMRSAREGAQQRARAIAMKFPQYRSYISYNAPSWRLRIGDFKNQDDAQRALQRLRAAFPAYGREMIIVRDHINVWGN